MIRFYLFIDIVFHKCKSPRLFVPLLITGIAHCVPIIPRHFYSFFSGISKQPDFFTVFICCTTRDSSHNVNIFFQGVFFDETFGELLIVVPTILIKLGVLRSNVGKSEGGTYFCFILTIDMGGRQMSTSKIYIVIAVIVINNLQIFALFQSKLFLHNSNVGVNRIF